MKKYILFTVIFIAAFYVIGVGSGMILTMFYEPDIYGAWTSLSSTSEIVAPMGSMAPLASALGALAIAFGSVKLIGRKVAL